MIATIRRVASGMLPRVTHFRGASGEAWIAGVGPDEAAIAAAYCGTDTAVVSSNRVWRTGLVPAASLAAEQSAFALLRGLDEDMDAATRNRAVEVPLAVQHRAELPCDTAALHAGLRKNSDKEDLRRIRRANFSCRVETDPDVIRQFYDRYYRPYIARRHSGGAALDGFERFSDAMDHGGELLCLDKDGEWVAGILNIRNADSYGMRYLGLRDGDPAINALRAIPALFIQSMERAIALEYHRATMGTTLPFLGEGNARFKAKWGSTLVRSPFNRATARLLLDLRHEAARAFLCREPIAFCHPDGLHGARWLADGPDALKRACRDVNRFPGIARWHVIGTPDVIDGARDTLAQYPAIRPVAVPDSDGPLWLGDWARTD